LSKKWRRKWIRRDVFHKDGKAHSIIMQKTNPQPPHPARIMVSYRFRQNKGGVRSWEDNTIYDRNFDDWNYAHAIYDEILRKALEESE